MTEAREFETILERAERLDRAVQAASCKDEPAVWKVRLFSYACMRKWVKATLRKAAYIELCDKGFEPDEKGITAMLSACEEIGYAYAVDDTGEPLVICRGGSPLDTLMGIAWGMAMETGHLTRQPMQITFNHHRSHDDG